MIRPLEYNTGLSLEEAGKRYTEAREEFGRVKRRYSRFFWKFKRNMREPDKKALTDCVGVLLPLNLEASVQEQARQEASSENTLHYQISQLQGKIMEYLATFRNTGIKVIAGGSNLGELF